MLKTIDDMTERQVFQVLAKKIRHNFFARSYKADISK